MDTTKLTQGGRRGAPPPPLDVPGIKIPNQGQPTDPKSPGLQPGSRHGSQPNSPGLGSGAKSGSSPQSPNSPKSAHAIDPSKPEVPMRDDFVPISEAEFREVVYNRQESDDEDESRYREYEQIKKQVDGLQQKITAQAGGGKSSSMIRGIVSQNKNRYISEEFNLDLTYITDRIIAMGFPAKGMEAIYRNDFVKVKSFLDKKHKTFYKVYNLCVEKDRQYPPEDFNGRTATYGFHDHNPPPLELIERICNDIENFLRENNQNIVAIHCKAGKGRTGMIISCFLLHQKSMDSAKDSLLYYGLNRTSDGKGVTIQSQIRYVYYYEHMIRKKRKFESLPNKLWSISRIFMGPKPESKTLSKYKPSIKILEHAVERNVKIDTAKNPDTISSFHYQTLATPMLCFEFAKYPNELVGDLCFEIYDGSTKVFHFWLNTNFINATGKMVFTKEDMDIQDSSADRFSEGFAIEIEFVEVVAEITKMIEDAHSLYYDPDFREF